MRKRALVIWLWWPGPDMRYSENNDQSKRTLYLFISYKSRQNGKIRKVWTIDKHQNIRKSNNYYLWVFARPSELDRIASNIHSRSHSFTASSYENCTNRQMKYVNSSDNQIIKKEKLRYPSTFTLVLFRPFGFHLVNLNFITKEIAGPLVTNKIPNFPLYFSPYPRLFPQFYVDRYILLIQYIYIYIYSQHSNPKYLAIQPFPPHLHQLPSRL